jgi:hypothetical protein
LSESLNIQILDESSYLPHAKTLGNRDTRLNKDGKDPCGLIFSSIDTPNILIDDNPTTVGFVTNRDNSKPILHLNQSGSHSSLTPINYAPGDYFVYLASNQQQWGYYRLNFFLSDNIGTNVTDVSLANGIVLYCRYIGKIRTNAYLVGDRYYYTSQVLENTVDDKLQVSNNVITYNGTDSEIVYVDADYVDFKFLFFRFGYGIINKPLECDIQRLFNRTEGDYSGTCQVFVTADDEVWDEVWPGARKHLILIDDNSLSGGEIFPFDLRDDRSLDAMYVGKVHIIIRTNPLTPLAGCYIASVEILDGLGLGYVQEGGDYILFYQGIQNQAIGLSVVDCRYVPLHMNSHLFRPVVTSDKNINLRQSSSALSTGNYNISITTTSSPVLLASDFETDPDHLYVSGDFLGVASITVAEDGNSITKTELSVSSDSDLVVNSDQEPQYTDGVNKYTLRLDQWLYRDYVTVDPTTEDSRILNPLKMTVAESADYKFPVKLINQMSPPGMWRPPISKSGSTFTKLQFSSSSSSYSTYRVWLALDEPAWDNFDTHYRGQMFLMPYEGTSESLDPPKTFPFNSSYGLLHAYYLGKIVYSTKSASGYWGPMIKEDPDIWEDDYNYTREDYVGRGGYIHRCRQTHLSSSYNRPLDGSGDWDSYWSQVADQDYQDLPGGTGGSPGPDGWVDHWGTAGISYEAPDIRPDTFTVSVRVNYDNIVSFTQGGTETLVDPVVLDVPNEPGVINLRVASGIIIPPGPPTKENIQYCRSIGTRLTILEPGYYEIYYSVTADRPFTGRAGLRLNGEPNPVGGLCNLHFSVDSTSGQFAVTGPPNVVHLDTGDYFELMVACTNPLELSEVAYLLKSEVKILRFVEYPLSPLLYNAVDIVNLFLDWKGHIEPSSINSDLNTFKNLAKITYPMTAVSVSGLDYVWDIKVTLQNQQCLTLHGMVISVGDKRLFPGPMYYDLVEDKRTFSNNAITYRVYDPSPINTLVDSQLQSRLTTTDTNVTKYSGRPSSIFEINVPYDSVISPSVDIPKNGPPFIIRQSYDPSANLFTSGMSSFPNGSLVRNHFQLVDQDTFITGKPLGSLTFTIDFDGLLSGSITNSLYRAYQKLLYGVTVSGSVLTPNYYRLTIVSMPVSSTITYKVCLATTEGTGFSRSGLQRYEERIFLFSHDDKSGNPYPLSVNIFPFQHHASTSVFTAGCLAQIEIRTDEDGKATSGFFIANTGNFCKFDFTDPPDLDVILARVDPNDPDLILDSIFLKRDNRSLVIYNDSYSLETGLPKFFVWISADQVEWENLNSDFRGKMFLSPARDGLCFDPHFTENQGQLYAHSLGVMQYSIDEFVGVNNITYHYPTLGNVLDVFDTNMSYYGGGSNPAYRNYSEPTMEIGPYLTGVKSLDLISNRRFYRGKQETSRYYNERVVAAPIFDREQTELWDIWHADLSSGWNSVSSYCDSFSDCLFLTRASESMSSPFNVSGSSVTASKVGQTRITFEKVDDNINLYLPTYKISEIEVMGSPLDLYIRPNTNEIYLSTDPSEIRSLTIPRTFQFPPVFSYAGSSFPLRRAEPQDVTYNIYLTSNDAAWDQVYPGLQNSLFLSPISPPMDSDTLKFGLLTAQLLGIVEVQKKQYSIGTNPNLSLDTSGSLVFGSLPSQDISLPSNCLGESRNISCTIPQDLKDSTLGLFTDLLVVDIFDSRRNLGLAKVSSLIDGIYNVYQMDSSTYFEGFSSWNTGSEYDADMIAPYEGKIFLSQAEPDIEGVLRISCPEMRPYWWDFSFIDCVKIGTCSVGQQELQNWVSTTSDIFSETDLSLSETSDWENAIVNLISNKIVIGYPSLLSTARKSRMEQFGFSFLTLEEVLDHDWLTPVAIEDLDADSLLVKTFTFYMLFVTEDGDVLFRGPKEKEVDGTLVDVSFLSLRSGRGKFRNPLTVRDSLPVMTRLDYGVSYYLYLAPDTESWNSYAGSLFLSPDSPILIEGEYYLQASLLQNNALYLGKILLTKEIVSTQSYGDYVFEVLPTSDYQVKTNQNKSELYWEERPRGFEYQCLSNGAGLYTSYSPANIYNSYNPLLRGKINLILDSRLQILKMPGYETHYPTADAFYPGIYYIYRSVADGRWRLFSDSAFLSSAPPDSSNEESWDPFVEDVRVKSFCVGTVIVRYGPSQSLSDIYPGVSKIIEGSDYMQILVDNGLRYNNEVDWKTEIRATDVVLIGQYWSYANGNGSPLSCDIETSIFSQSTTIQEGLYNVYVSSMESGWDGLSTSYRGSLFLCTTNPNTEGDLLTGYIGTDEVQALKIGKVSISYFDVNQDIQDTYFSGFSSSLVGGSSNIPSLFAIPDSSTTFLYYSGDVYASAVMLPIYEPGNPIYLQLEYLRSSSLSGSDCNLTIDCWVLDYTIDLDEYYSEGQHPPEPSLESLRTTLTFNLEDLLNSKLKVFLISNDAGEIAGQHVNVGDSVVCRVWMDQTKITSRASIGDLQAPIIESIRILFCPVKPSENL